MLSFSEPTCGVTVFNRLQKTGWGSARDPPLRAWLPSNRMNLLLIPWMKIASKAQHSRLALQVLAGDRRVCGDVMLLQDF